MPRQDLTPRRGRPRELEDASRHEVVLDAPSRAAVARIEREQDVRGVSAAIRWALAQVDRRRKR